MQKYKCKDCGEPFEKAETGCCGAEVKCPKCASTRIWKLEPQDKPAEPSRPVRRYG